VAQDHDALRLSTLRWRLDDAAGRHWRAWDDEVVIFHEPTAATHLLPADAATVFLTLRDAGPDGLDEVSLWHELGESSAPADERKQHLRDILGSLQASGLAECRAP
jgi:PqqD family protein of HPr-rel-A system